MTEGASGLKNSYATSPKVLFRKKVDGETEPKPANPMSSEK